jgi:hypothetical protein
VAATAGVGMTRTLAALALALSVAAPGAAQDSYLLVIVGLGGDPALSAEFHQWATTLVAAARDRYGLPPSHVVYLGEKPEVDPTVIDGRSTREGVEAAVGRLASEARPGDRIFIVLFGHGSESNGEARFNLPGPDLTAADFAKMLDRLGAQSVVFVDTSSASGPFVPALSGRDRTIVTATKTGGEKNATRFGGFFVEALAGGDADLDKDGRVSILEAFTYARRRVVETYEKAGNLLSEHAVLDDNGDGKGSDTPDPLDGDGALARTMFVTATAAAPAAPPADPALRALYEEKKALEDRIAALRTSKDTMAPEEYEQKLEPLLVELARKTREIRELERKKGA